MHLSADLLRTHLAYTAWASKRLVEAASVLSEAELTRDFATSEHSVLGTLVHVFAADRIWLARIQGHAPARFINPEADMHLSVLRDDWPTLLANWQHYAAALNDTDTGQVISYKDLKGNAYQSPLWQIVLHVVNHATHHRGQASGMIRAMGHTPPPLDLIAYYRQPGNAHP
ncbi:MAG: DinB family protein [Bryobacteraceae bacterium]|nr:DinB family protein [Bryobacteraceae bacterium]